MYYVHKGAQYVAHCISSFCALNAMAKWQGLKRASPQQKSLWNSICCSRTDGESYDLESTSTLSSFPEKVLTHFTVFPCQKWDTITVACSNLQSALHFITSQCETMTHCIAARSLITCSSCSCSWRAMYFPNHSYSTLENRWRVRLWIARCFDGVSFLSSYALSGGSEIKWVKGTGKSP